MYEQLVQSFLYITVFIALVEIWRMPQEKIEMIKKIC
jgi:hypothetical protein